MANYDVGSLIKRLRKQRGLTQEELAYPIIDRATLSKIEGGKVMPGKKTIEALLERLGYSPNNTADFFLDNEMVAAQKIINEIDNYITRRPLVVTESTKLLASKVDALLAELESNKRFMQNKLNFQYILITKSQNAFNRNEDSEKVMSMLMEALKITIPEYNERYIEDYYISKQEFLIINLIAAVLNDIGEQGKAINICYALKSNLDKHILDKFELGARYPVAACNLANYLAGIKRYEEAVEVCTAAEKVCKDTRFVFSLPNIIGLKAMCFCEIGNKEEGKRLLRQAYYAHAMLGQFESMENLQEYAIENLGKEI